VTWTEYLYDISSFAGQTIHIAIQSTSANANAAWFDDFLITMALGVTVIEPNGGEQWEIGRQNDIRWSASGLSQVNIDYSYDGGTTWSEVVHSTVNDGQHTWSIPNTPSNNCLVSVSSTDGAISDISDAPFSIFLTPIRYTRIEFYENVSANASNPENLIDAGSAGRFKLRIINELTSNILTGYATIRTQDSYVTITDSTATYNNVIAGDSSWSVDEFEIWTDSSTPAGRSIEFTLVVEQQLTPTGPWYSMFSFPVQPLVVGMVLMDDDANPDSNGDNDGIVEQGESVEVIPLIDNVFDEALYEVQGTLTSPHTFIDVWDEHIGASGTVYATYRYNVQSNQAQPVDVGTTNIQPEADFVFDCASLDTNEIQFNLLVTSYLGGASGSNWDLDGVKMMFGSTLTLESAPVVSVDTPSRIPLGFSLRQNYPNPFNATSTIRYNLARATHVRIIVFDVEGHEIERLVDASLEPGAYQITWNGEDSSGRDVPSGIYIARMLTPEFTKSIKMILLK
jgi:hypothetical protein